MNVFEITLRIAYFTMGYLNFKTEPSILLGGHGENLRFVLPDETEINMIINRTINPNGTVRIYGGQLLLNFIQCNYSHGDLVNYRIVDRNTVEIVN